MTDWMELVIEERNQLNILIERLEEFLESTTFTDLAEHDARLLMAQCHAMRSYQLILAMRIARFSRNADRP